MTNYTRPVPVPDPLHPPYPLDPPTVTALRATGPRRGTVGLLVAAAAGGMVAVGLGVYGRLHEPAFTAVSIAGFSSGLAAKAWLATGALLLATVQLGSALIMYGRLQRIAAPCWVGGLHRWSGRVAVLLTVPVAVHCLYALGLQFGSVRVAVHGLAGCFLYGAFVATMLALTVRGTPGWALPLLGGAVFTALVALWLTSSVWFFSTSGIIF